MEDAVIGLYTHLAPDNMRQVAWIPDQDAYTALDTDNQALLRTSVPDMNEDTLLRLSTINEQLFTDSTTLESFPHLIWLDENHAYFKRHNDLYMGTIKARKWEFTEWRTLPDDIGEYHVSKNGKIISYTKENNLYIIDSKGNEQAITTDSDKNIVNGQVVSRYEIGIEQGVFFSPSGKYLAFYRKDESKVTDYPVIHWDKTPAININEKYPMAGADSEEVWLGIYNLETQQTTFMDTGKDTDHYLTNVTWAPDEKHIYIGIVQRNQKHLSLNKYKVKTGKLANTLFDESDDKYIHPVHPLYFIPENEKEFIWWSKRDGHDHLYRYNSNGKLLNQVTSGDWEVNEIIGWNTVAKEIIISSNKVSPLNKNIYAVNWESGDIRRIDDAEGMHSASVNDSGTYYLDRYSNYTSPRVIRVASTVEDWAETLLEAENTLTDYAHPTVKHFTITAADDKTPLYARLILPPEFDESKTYPAIVYLYNGPGVQLLHNSFPESGNLWYDYMAQRGYVVFTMDGRGSSNRGMEFEQVIYRNLGQAEMKDQLRGIEYLKSLPFIDADRLGIHGWSYGGFMTISLMLNHPDVFTAGVAGGPVTDWNMYEIMYTERYMDTPQDNPEGYKKTSLLDKVENLKGDLLIIHGALDATVVLQHSMKFIRECVKKNIQLDYFTYPAHPHNVRGVDRVHLMQKVTDYFDAHLK